MAAVSDDGLGRMGPLSRQPIPGGRRGKTRRHSMESMSWHYHYRDNASVKDQPRTAAPKYRA